MAQITRQKHCTDCHQDCNRPDCMRHQQGQELKRWQNTTVDVPLGVLVDAINRHEFGQYTVERLQGVKVPLDRNFVMLLVSECIDDTDRFMIGACLHE